MYIKSVLEHLPSDDGIHYIFYCFDKNNPLEELGIETNVKHTIVNTRTIKTALDSPKNIFGIFKLVGHRFAPLKKYELDTFVQFDFMLGMPKWRGVKKLVIGYDLIPLIMKNEYMPSPNYAWHHTHGKKAKVKAVLRSVYYRFRYWLHYKVFRKADNIICISKATARTFQDVLGISESKLITIQLAPVLSKSAPDSKIADNIGKPYVFYIGGTDSRKRIQDIVYAYNVARSRGEDIALVLAGNEFKELEHIPDVTGRNAILRSPYRADIYLVGFISDEEKMGLYTNARAFIFTTTYEGFGLPVVEAMSAQCPVIAYNNSSIPEATGDAALLAKTGDFVEVARCIINLKENQLRTKLISRGIAQAKKFNWESYTNKFRDAL
jgi:glycosyltransferase involved in cell wall biosynthesis